MTTSQASRVFGIPYNSLLMYVRGKYGKSLRLDVLKKNTPAANDDLNVIGNSRSTPKEKAAGVKKEDGFSGKDRRGSLVRRAACPDSSHSTVPASTPSTMACYSLHQANPSACWAWPACPLQTPESRT